MPLRVDTDGWVLADISDPHWCARQYGIASLRWEEVLETCPMRPHRIRITNSRSSDSVPDFFLRGCEDLGQVDLSELSDVKKVGGGFLRGCSSLQQVNLSGLTKVTKVGESFLSGCTSLPHLDLLPLSNVTNVGESFLRGCCSLQKVELSSLSNVTTVENSFLAGCSSLQQVDVSRMSNVTDVGNSFLRDCTMLQKVDLSGLSNVTKMGSWFLSGCSVLQHVDLSPLSNMAEVGNWFLEECSSLQQVDLTPLSNLTKTGNGFLRGCSSLQQLDLSPLSNVIEVGSWFLRGCLSLQELTFPDESILTQVISDDVKLPSRIATRSFDASEFIVSHSFDVTEVFATTSFDASEFIARRSFEYSEFFKIHSRADLKPRKLFQLLAALDSLVHAFAESRGIPPNEADKFLGKLQENVLETAVLSGCKTELSDAQKLMFLAVRMWTSAERLRGCELCSILNAAIRNDTMPALEHAMVLVHAINAFCVTRRGISVRVLWPADHKVYRGGAMPREHRDFFQPGKAYRAPMYVATSLDKRVARLFMRLLPEPAAEQEPAFQEPVLWVFHFDGTLPENLRCVHVNYIDRTDGSVSGEREMLFAPYSVFTVRICSWEADPLVDGYTIRPNIIEVDVTPDNVDAPSDLPLAPWC